MIQRVIGTYSFGFEDCQLVLRNGTGGEFYNCPGRGEVPRIKIGADEKEWKDVVGVLLHEAMEFSMNRLGCRYEDSYDLGRDMSAYLFVMRHQTFSDCCARAGDFVSSCLPDLSAAWSKWRRPRQPKNRKRRKPCKK